MKELLFIFGNVMFAVIFSILAIFVFFLHIPKEEKFKYYRYSRYTLGYNFLLIIIYCCLKQPLMRTDSFTILSFQALFSVLFSWLTYLSFIIIIYSEKYKRRRFFLDGAIPATLMLISAVIGLKFPKVQHINSVTFGIIFGFKCAWMLRICLIEYKKCIKNLDNYYDNTPTISWMKSLLLATIVLSVMTIVHFYIPGIHIIYFSIFLIIYVFITFKVIDYLPTKISEVREKSVLIEVENKEKQTIAADFKQKIASLLEKWVNDKGFTKSDITIKDVAQEIGTNHTYLSKYINSELNMTFTVYLHTLRIEESKKWLLSSEKISVEEIGIKVGIPEIYNFSRWFKTITGTTPQQYRKSNR